MHTMKCCHENTTVWMGGWLLSNSGFLSESLPQDKMSDGNPGFKASLCALASVTHSNSSSPLMC